MELPLSQLHISGTILMLVLNLLLWEKAASIPECHTEEGGCWNPLVETFNSAINRAENIRNLAEQMHQEFFHNEFSSNAFANLITRMNRRDQFVLKARLYCHANDTNPPDRGTEHMNIKSKKYLKTLINYVGAWTSPLYHLALELSTMPDVPETILSKANQIEENNKELLDDLRWILTKAYPTAKIKEKFPNWEHLPYLKSNNKDNKFLAMFNLSYCLRLNIFYTANHLRTLKCRITGKDC
ncbi:prolactin-8A9-like isoform X1 [Mesocricetus auratus]|uniref:Prolactin-8A9-like isoform X1 n=1 Tax=Mesocricetus auratus TaxID=10036 RepID=A0A1U7QFG3_MESAU|nr:prolactin-8A9-like isoform X1 [Mesocricetus auratus]